MNRDTVLALTLAFFALLALGVAAATLTDTTAVGAPGSGSGGDGSGSGSGTSDQPGRGEGLGGSAKNEVTRGFPAPAFCLEWLRTPRAIGGIIAFFLLVGGVAYYRTGSILPPLALTIALGIPVWMVWFLLTACGSWNLGMSPIGTTRNASFGIMRPGGSGGSSGEATEAVASAPSLVLGLLIVVAIAVAVVLLFVATGDDVEAGTTEAEPEPDSPPPDVTEVARAAGRAADRIEGEADVDNEVYRAWTEMTTHLDVDRPESSTPAEFADAAVGAGMTRTDVEELTTLFEEVRYGGETATDERESRAIAALRRIESGYVDGSGEGGDADRSGGADR